MAGKFELKQGAAGKWTFNLKAGNGEIILTSETYESKAAAENGIASVRKNAVVDANFDRRESKLKEPYFVLLAANKQIIGKSEMYSSQAARENGIKSVMAHAPGAAEPKP